MLRALALLLFTAIPALAAPAPAPGYVISDKDLNDTLDLGEEIEARADGDLDGDGDIDTAYIARGDQRILTVLIRQDGPGPKQRYTPGGSVRYASDAARPAQLSIARSVLVVSDKLGTDVTLASTYRYRKVAGPRMRLIGLDSTLESGDAERDGFEMSWNLVTGDIVTRTLRAEPAVRPLRYARLFERKSKRPSPPVMMERTPDPELIMVDLQKK